MDGYNSYMITNLLRSTNHEGCGYHFLCILSNRSHTGHVTSRIVEHFQVDI